MRRRIACIIGLLFLLCACNRPVHQGSEPLLSVSFPMDTMKYTKAEADQIKKTLKRGAMETLELPEFDLSSASKIGIIVPHHLLAAEAIQMGLESVGSFEPEVIVLLAPNHKATYRKPVITHSTPFEALGHKYAISPLVESLLSEKFAVESHERFLSEHGLYSILPFVSTSFDVPLVPLILAPGLEEERVDALHEKLDVLLGSKKVLWIASIDFSHYLPAVISEKKDQETMQWIADRNFEALYSASNDYFDSPEVMRLWLKQFENTKLLWHSNSAFVTGSGFNEEGTSYMVYFGY